MQARGVTLLCDVKEPEIAGVELSSRRSQLARQALVSSKVPRIDERRATFHAVAGFAAACVGRWADSSAGTAGGLVLRSR